MPARLLCAWDSPDKNRGVGCHLLLQGIFPKQGSNPWLLHWQADSLPLSHQGSPVWSIGILISFPSIWECCLIRSGLFTQIFIFFLHKFAHLFVQIETFLATNPSSESSDIGYISQTIFTVPHFKWQDVVLEIDYLEQRTYIKSESPMVVFVPWALQFLA